MITNDSLKNRRKGGFFLFKKSFKSLTVLFVSIVLVISISCVSSLSVSAYTLKTYALTLPDFVNLVNNGSAYLVQNGFNTDDDFYSKELPIDLRSSNFKLYPTNYTSEEFYQSPFVAIYPDFMRNVTLDLSGYSCFSFNIGDTGSSWDMYSSTDLTNCRYLSLYFDVFFGFTELENNTCYGMDDEYSVLNMFPTRYVVPSLEVLTPDGLIYSFSFSSDLPNNSGIYKNIGEVCAYYTFDIRFTPEQVEHLTPGTKFEFLFDWDKLPDSSFELIFGFDSNNCFYEFTKDYNDNPGFEVPPGDSGIYNDYQSGILNENQQMIDDFRDKLNISSNPNELGLDDGFINSLSESYLDLTKSFRNSAFYSFLTTLCIPSVSIAVLGFVLYGKSK